MTINDFIKIIESENLRAVRAYLRKNPRDVVMARDEMGRNALYYAIFSHNDKIARELIEYGFDPLTLDGTGRASALHLAAAEGMWDFARYLVEQINMDVNVADATGATPLEYAMLFLLADKAKCASTNQMKIAHFLIAHGARFRPNMTGHFQEMKELMYMLIFDIYKINVARRITARSRMKMEIKFMIDALNEYNTLFFCDVIPNVPVRHRAPRRRATKN